jgi:hypothetical protein
MDKGRKRVIGNMAARKDALRRYFVYKMKLIELIHLHLLLDALNNQKFVPENVMGHDGRNFGSSVRTALLSWYCTIVDQSKGGLNVFELWRELFPKYLERVDMVWKQVKPHWGILRNFRNKCGFHADSPQSFLSAKQKVLDNPQVAKAMMSFLDLSKFLISREEEELSDFVPEVESLLLDFELGVRGESTERFLGKWAFSPEATTRRSSDKDA